MSNECVYLFIFYAIFAFVKFLPILETESISITDRKTH